MENSKEPLCRTCLKGNIKMFPLTHTFTGYEDINFALMLMSCTSVCVSPNDSLPHFICEKCVTTLIMAYTFKEQCEKSDLFLRTPECLETSKYDNEIIYDNNEILQEPDNEYENNDSDLRNDDLTNDFVENRKDKINNEKMIKNSTIGRKRFKSKKLLIQIQKHNDKKEIKQEISADISINSCPTQRIMDCLNEDETVIRKSKKKSKIYKCLECDKELTTRYGLIYHANRHAGKKYVCPVEDCRKVFLWEQSLKKHMHLHSTQKKYLCYLCGKGYTAADSLQYHIRKHSGERPHLCSYCGKTYMQAVALKYHMRSHNGERPHTCSKCKRSYIRPTQLRKHLSKYCGVGKSPPQRRSSK